jgi:hypothetical protein
MVPTETSHPAGPPGAVRRENDSGHVLLPTFEGALPSDRQIGAVVVDASEPPSRPHHADAHGFAGIARGPDVCGRKVRELPKKTIPPSATDGAKAADKEGHE